MSTALSQTTRPTPAHLAVPLERRPVPMGFIKTGRKSDKGYPQALDHFVITTLNRGPDVNGQPGNFLLDQILMESLVNSGHGDHDDKIRRLPITLATDDLEQVFQQQYLWYAGKKKAGESDGRTLTLWLHPRTKQPLASPMVLPWNPKSGDQHEDVAQLINVEGAFRLHTKFNCLIRDANARIGGVYRLQTVSAVNANQIPSSLLTLHELTGGHLRFLPMELVIRPQPVCPLVKGVPTPGVVHVCHVEMSLKEVRESGGARRLAIQEMRRQIAEAREFKAIEEEFKRLILSPNPLDEPDELETGGSLELPAAGATVTTPPKKTLAEEHADALRLCSYEQALGEAWKQVSKDWAKFSRDERMFLEKLKNELKKTIQDAARQPDPLTDEAAFDSLLKAQSRDRADVYAWLHETTGEPKYHVRTPWPSGVEESHRKLIVDMLGGNDVKGGP